MIKIKVRKNKKWAFMGMKYKPYTRVIDSKRQGTYLIMVNLFHFIAITVMEVRKTEKYK